MKKLCILQHFVGGDIERARLKLYLNLLALGLGCDLLGRVLSSTLTLNRFESVLPRSKPLP